MLRHPSWTRSLCDVSKLFLNNISEQGDRQTNRFNAEGLQDSQRISKSALVGGRLTRAWRFGGKLYWVTSGISGLPDVLRACDKVPRHCAISSVVAAVSGLEEAVCCCVSSFDKRATAAILGTILSGAGSISVELVGVVGTGGKVLKVCAVPTSCDTIR